MKKCSACQKEFSIDEFGKRKSSKDGLRSQCKHCEKDYRNKFETKNKKREWQKKYSKSNHCKDYIANYTKNYKNQQKENYKKWLSNEDNKHRRREQAKLAERERRKNPIYKLKNNISRQIRKALQNNKNGKKWESIVGYTLDQLKIHIQSTFTDGMSWENYGQWHIDHKKPIDSFIINKDNWQEDIKEIWALNNLQALWAKDNCSKSNKMIYL